MEDRDARAVAPAGTAVGPALEDVVTQHEAALLRYAGRILNDATAAQDVVQEAFLKLCRSWQRGLSLDGAITPWLYRTTHNAAVDYIRRESRLRKLHADQAGETDGTAAPLAGRALEEADQRALVLEHVRRLDPAEQQIVILRLQEGLSYSEISRVTQRTEGNVGCILHHAVKKLAQSLKKAGVA